MKKVRARLNLPRPAKKACLCKCTKPIPAIMATLQDEVMADDDHDMVAGTWSVTKPSGPSVR